MCCTVLPMQAVSWSALHSLTSHSLVLHDLHLLHTLSTEVVHLAVMYVPNSHSEQSVYHVSLLL
jgi:hypothetical protein